MKEQIRLYKKIIYILIPVIILIILFEAKARSLQNEFVVKKSLLEKDIENIDVLILGSSHAYYSINPEAISRKSFNLAANSQDLYYDYMLFEKYKAKLKNLKCIILSVSYFSLWYDLNEAPENWRKYFYRDIFGINSKSGLSISEIVDAKSYSLAFFYRFENVLLGTINPKLFYFGNQMNSSGWNIDTDYSLIDSTEISILKGKERVDFTNSLVNKDNYDGNVKLIRELIKYSNDNNIKMVFVTTPVSYPYILYMDKNHYDDFQKKVNVFVNNKNVIYLNYFFDKRFLIKDYVDYDHLRKKSALRFSEILRDTLESLNFIKSE